jgi:hypothetical protein
MDRPELTGSVRPFLSLVSNRLGERSPSVIYPCIRDLLENGLDVTRFSAGESKPQRQDVTQYLAAWSRHAGLNEEESGQWLIEYCKTVLASISTRTPAAIAHSTKSNLRYIYRSAVAFRCQFEQNPFRARCCTECPFCPEMQAKLRVEAEEALKPKPVASPPLPEPVLPVKQANRQQFEAAMRLALEEVQKGAKLTRVLQLLKERGLKTATGRDWRYGNLRTELLKWRCSIDKPKTPQ